MVDVCFSRISFNTDAFYKLRTLTRMRSPTLTHIRTLIYITLGFFLQLVSLCFFRFSVCLTFGASGGIYIASAFHSFIQVYWLTWDRLRRRWNDEKNVLVGSSKRMKEGSYRCSFWKYCFTFFLMYENSVFERENDAIR